MVADNDFTLAVQAVGPAPTDEWPHLVREKIVQIALERARMEDFARHVAATMDKNQKGWGIIEGTITDVKIDQARASRCFVTYTAWSSRSQEVKTETIRTEPTNSDSEAMNIARMAQSLIGHKVRMLKRPDLDAPGENKPKILFHLSDLGQAPQGQRQGNQAPQGQQQGNQAPEGNQAPQGQPSIPAREAMRRLFNAVHEQFPQLNEQQVRQASAAGMNALGVDAASQVEINQLTNTAMPAAQAWVASNVGQSTN